MAASRRGFLKGAAALLALTAIPAAAIASFVEIRADNPSMWLIKWGDDAIYSVFPCERHDFIPQTVTLPEPVQNAEIGIRFIASRTTP